MIERLGDFIIEEKIGEGGMSEVYRARQETLGREVALKILRPQLSGDQMLVRRFLHEAKAGASLTHPNIVQVYSVGTHDGYNYIAMEYVRGPSLKDYLRSRIRIPVSEALDIMIRLCDAMVCAERENIAHRDIKPANIMLDPDGRLKIADFGLAKCYLEDSGVTHLTKDGHVMGTVSYMSPEQGMGEKTDSRSDIYSMGIVFFELLCGRPPYKGEHPTSVIYLHVHEQAPNIRFYMPSVPVDVESVILRMMAKKPEDRPQSFGSLLAELEEMRSHLKLSFKRQTGESTPVPILDKTEVLPIAPLQSVPRCLVVEDDLDLADLCVHVLTSAGFSVIVAHDGQQALTLWRERSPDLIILDLTLPGLSGMAVLEERRERNLKGEILVTSCRSDWKTIRHAAEYGISGYLMKPFTADALANYANKALGIQLPVSNQEETKPIASSMDER